MRFREFRVINEAPESNVVVIGDSIAVGIGGESAYAKGGISTTEVLNRVNAFIKTGKAKGATVILSSGASNSATVEIEGGEKKPANLAPIAQQLKALKDAGASVALVGVGSGKSIWFPPTKFTNGKKYQVDLTGINQQLETMAAANGAKFLGPLEDYDNGMHSGKGDGIHPYAGYKKLLAAGSKGAGVTLGPKDQAPGAPPAKSKTDAGAGTKPAPAVEKDNATPATGSLEVPSGSRGFEVQQIQRALMALGYDLPKHGADGIRGPETSGAISKFQEANGLQKDGVPGEETVAKLNDILKTKPDIVKTLATPDFSKIAPSGKSSGASGPAAGNTANAGTAVKFFISKGYTPEQAAGIVGNLQAESGANLNTAAVGDGGKAYGIAQWHPDRQQNFKRAMGKDIQGSSLEDQLAFIIWELKNTEKNADSYLRRAQNAEQAAAIFDKYYERSSGEHRDRRIANAASLLTTATA